jgi:succinate dehydrogenase / fumarate reductase, cytochrome b subunit
VALTSSSIGRKVIMGICGFIWAGFVFTHMAGNLLIFVSAEAYNKYGHAITSNKALIYSAEVVLLFALVVHAFLGIQLYLENRRASPKKYAVAANKEKRATTASKTMAYQGSIVLFFIIYHLITFKYGTEYSVTYDGVEMRDLHRLMVEIFNQPAYVVGYIVCLLLLGLHLSHGFASVFQTLGLNHPKYMPTIKKLSIGYAAVVTAGFIAQPVYIFISNM